MLLMLKARMEWIVVDLSITPSWLSSALKSTRARFFAARSDLKETRLQSRKIFLLYSEPVFNHFFNRTSLCLPSPLPPALVLTLPLTLFLSALNHRPVLNYKRQTVQFQLISTYITCLNWSLNVLISPKNSSNVYFALSNT